MAGSSQVAVGTSGHLTPATNLVLAARQRRLAQEPPLAEAVRQVAMAPAEVGTTCRPKPATSPVLAKRRSSVPPSAAPGTAPPWREHLVRTGHSALQNSTDD